MAEVYSVGTFEKRREEQNALENGDASNTAWGTRGYSRGNRVARVGPGDVYAAEGQHRARLSGGDVVGHRAPALHGAGVGRSLEGAAGSCLDLDIGLIIKPSSWKKFGLIISNVLPSKFDPLTAMIRFQTPQ